MAQPCTGLSSLSRLTASHCTCDLPVLKTPGQRQTVNLREQNQEQITNTPSPTLTCQGLCWKLPE